MFLLVVVAAMAGFIGHALWVGVAVGVCGGFALVVGWIAYRNIQRTDAPSPDDVEVELGQRPIVLDVDAHTVIAPRLPAQCTTLLIGVPSEQRTEIAARLAGTRDRKLLIELVERYVAPDGLVSLAHELLDGEPDAADRIASALDGLTKRERSETAGGFRDAVPLCSALGPGTSVLAIAFPSRTDATPRPRSRGELIDQIEGLSPLKRELAFDTCWVPASDDRAFDAATLWEMFPELTRLSIDGD